MRAETFTVALVTDVFPTEEDWDRLPDVVRDAGARGAELVVLPELPLNAWSPATKVARPEDAEDVDGPRQSLMSRVARDAGIPVLGGAIIRDPDSGIRHNTALLYDGGGWCRARYGNVHGTSEEVSWEASHHQPGPEPQEAVGGHPMTLGLQICSDVNRPTGSELLAAMGAEVILAPRCTPLYSYERWKLVLQANAVTSGAYVISTNRPGPEKGVPIGGASLAIGPGGEVVLESQGRVSTVTLSRDAVKAAGAGYPGYLKRFPQLYARGWDRLA